MCDSEAFLENEQSKTTDKEARFVQTFFYVQYVAKSGIADIIMVHPLRKTGRLCKNVSNGHRSTVPLLLLM